MNIEKLLAFYQAGQKLHEEGVIGTSDYGKSFHVLKEKIINMDNLQIKNRYSSEYPYEIFVMVDGMKIFSLAHQDEVKHLPQFKAIAKTELESRIKELQEYMEEDINFEGDENIA